MRSQAQYTIHSLNDVTAATSAPSNPYKGQLWVDTSKTPPVTMVYNGTKWVEQNGTDTLRSSITTLTTKQATFETNLNGLTSTVSTTTKKVETLESDLGVVEEKLLGTQTQVSELKQTASEISASVANKADAAYGSSSSSFGWSLKSNGFYLYSGAKTVMSVTSSGLSVVGAIDATSGSIGGLTIDGYLYFGGDSTYYISANYNDGNYYINLPGLKIDKASQAVFSGKLSAPSGTIGGFTITTSAIYKTKTSYNSSSSGVYIGTDGIGLGAGAFYVTSAGKLYATNAEIYGTLYLSGSESYAFYNTTGTFSYSTTIGGNGISSVVTISPSGGSTHIANSYIGPCGSIIVPASTYYDDGILFGVSNTKSFRRDNLTVGIACSHERDTTGKITSALTLKSGGDEIMTAIYNSMMGRLVNFGCSGWDVLMTGNWYPGQSYSGYLNSYYSMQMGNVPAIFGTWSLIGKMYCGTNPSHYLTNVTIGSTNYPYLSGTWYGSTLKFGTSTTGYNMRIDQDQITFYYGSTEVGEIEAYSTYVDIQGTFKTNGKNWISSSDARVKNSIQDFTDAYSVIFDNLKPRLYKYNAGRSNRLHTGFIVQETLAAMEVAKVSTSDFAAVCAFGDPNDEKTEWGIRYDEIIPMNTWEIQKLKARVAELEKIIKTMEVSQ